MKVILLSEVSAVEAVSGAERVLREQALGLQRSGYHVSLVVRAPYKGSAVQVAVGEAVERRYPVIRHNQPAFVLSSIVHSIRAFDLNRPSSGVDTAIIHQSLAGLGPILRRKDQVGEWVYMCLSLAHEEYAIRLPPPPTALGRMHRSLNAKIRLWIERAVLRRCDRVVVLSDFMRQRVTAVHGIPPGKLYMVPGAADHDRFFLPKDRREIRRDLELPSNKVVLFTVRNLEPRMGVDALLEAMADLGEEGRDLLLLIGGEGPLRPTLEKMVREKGLAGRVSLLGFIPEGVLPKYYQAADLVVMPSQELEGFGLVTVEAMACGTPVLGTPVGAIPEVLARVDPGLIADGIDGRALAGSIRRILKRFRDDPDEKQRLSARGRALVEQDYTWDHHSSRLNEILNGIAPKSAACTDGPQPGL